MFQVTFRGSDTKRLETQAGAAEPIESTSGFRINAQFQVVLDIVNHGWNLRFTSVEAMI